MKVGIITVIGYLNYGNRLQNYAVQEVLKKINVNSETIYNEQREDLTLFRKIITLLKSNSTKENIDFILKKFLGKIRGENRDKLNQLDEKKMINLKNFTEKYINQSKFQIIGNKIPENLDKEYDYFIVGSDQVWNPFHRKGSPIDFLNFTDSTKKIAYSASFGIDSIPKEYIEFYSANLKTFNNISVREDSGAEIVNKLTGKNSLVVVDPTMMLDENEWSRIIREDPNKPKGKYLLTYFLGSIDSPKKDIISKLARESNLKVVNLAQIEEEEHYTVGPGEFLDYIKNSHIFLTDSFHGVVFSILFRKNFIVFGRGNMNTRIETLLTKFNLENRFIDNLDLNQAYKTDFGNVKSILEEERNKAINFLISSMSRK